MKGWLGWPVLRFAKGMVFILPASVVLSYWWNLGSFLFILMLVQVVSGVCLTFCYSNEMLESFDSVWRIHLESFNGSLIHWIHMNNSSFLFFFVFSFG